jgi:putative SbcD/Mre11-related phosphoesterase
MSQVLPQNELYVFDEWLLTPEGAAIHRRERTAVIADVHLGYEWARGASGDCVPAHSLKETLERLALVLDRAPITRLIVAGDLVESARPCHRTDHDVRRLRTWLRAQGISLTVLAGNHDRQRSRANSSRCGESRFLPECHTVADWTIGHGDRPIAGSRTITGHHHPALKIEGITARCFVLGPGRIILPAFSQNAAGCDLLTAALPRGLLGAGFRCIASTDEELLDFGPLSELRRLRSGSRASYRIRR